MELCMGIFEMNDIGTYTAVHCPPNVQATTNMIPCCQKSIRPTLASLLPSGEGVLSPTWFSLFLSYIVHLLARSGYRPQCLPQLPRKQM
eukprot:561011-Pelagomonas_calceolata.AAC.1